MQQVLHTREILCVFGDTLDLTLVHFEGSKNLINKKEREKKMMWDLSLGA